MENSEMGVRVMGLGDERREYEIFRICFGRVFVRFRSVCYILGSNMIHSKVCKQIFILLHLELCKTISVLYKLTELKKLKQCNQLIELD